MSPSDTIPIEDVRSLYELRVRREPTYPGSRLEKGLHTVRLVENGRGWVSWSDLEGADIDASIEVEIERFRELGVLGSLEWKLYGSDRPEDLLDRLVAHGFEPKFPEEAVLVLDLENLPDAFASTDGHDVRKLRGLAGLEDLVGIMRAVWPEDADDTARFIEEAHDADPAGQSLWLAYVDGKAVAEGRVEFACKEFAGIWGGATLPGYRNRGLYTALVAARAAEARERGCRFLTIDASPMSRPILEKRGFRLLDTALECNYRGS